MNKSLKIDKLIQMLIDGNPLSEVDYYCKELNLNDVGTRGRTPLMVAAAEGLFDAVKLLIVNGASITSVGYDNMTALHEASGNDQVQIADYLLSLGADVNAETIDGITPLMCAAAWGNVMVARVLLKNGADWFHIDKKGSTALDIAEEKGEDNWLSSVRP